MNIEYNTLILTYYDNILYGVVAYYIHLLCNNLYKR